MLFGPLAPDYVRDQVPALAAYTTWNWTHRLGGFTLVLVGLRQVRGFHRWHPILGYLYVALAATMSIGGAWMAITAPFSPAETLPALLFAALMLVFVTIGILTIQAGLVADHCRWMRRSYALALAPLTVRLVHMLLTTILSEREAMAPAFWMGWVLPLLVLEVRR